MKPITFILAMFMASGVFAQKCNYLANSVSEWDGTQLLITETSLLSKNIAEGKLEVYSSLYADSAVILSFVFYTDANINLDGGDEIELELVNGDAIVLSIHKQPVLSKAAERKLSCNALLTAAQEEALLNAEVQKITFRGDTTVFAASITKNRLQDVVASKVFCITSARNE